MTRAFVVIFVVLVVHADVIFFTVFSIANFNENRSVVKTLSKAIDSFRTPDAVVYCHCAESDLVKALRTGSRLF